MNKACSWAIYSFLSVLLVVHGCRFFECSVHADILQLQKVNGDRCLVETEDEPSWHSAGHFELQRPLARSHPPAQHLHTARVTDLCAVKHRFLQNHFQVLSMFQHVQHGPTCNMILH